MLAEREAGNEHLAADEAVLTKDRSLEPALLGDEERSPAPGQPERRPQPAEEDARLHGSSRDAHHNPVALGHIDPTVWAVGHRGRVGQALGERLHPKAHWRDWAEGTGSGSRSRRSERERRHNPGGMSGVEPTLSFS